MEKKRLYLITLRTETKSHTQGTWKIPTKSETGQSMPFISHAEQPLRPRGAHIEFVCLCCMFFHFVFCFSRFFQKPAHKEDKNKEILSKMKQTGEAETAYI